MKVLHINCNYISTTLHQIMIEHLEKLNVQNTVFVPTYDKSLAIINTNDNVNVKECFKKWDRILFGYKQKKIKTALERAIKPENYDLIHAYTLFTDGNCARNISKKYNIPYVVAVRNTDINTFFRYMRHLRGRGVKIMRDATNVFFLSEICKKHVFDKYIPDKYKDEINKKTHIIPNGIDSFWLDNIFAKEEPVSENIKLIYAGRIDKNKNISSIQKAINSLQKQGYNISLTVVGKIIDQKQFQKIKNDKNITYISPQPKEELMKLYREHDLFIMPSFKETFGLVYAEAMSQGLPVIYTRGQGFDGQFEKGMVGYSVKADDIDEICEAIKKCTHNIKKIGNNAVNCVKKFDWNTITVEYKTIYENILKAE